MGMMDEGIESLTQLGRQVEWTRNPDDAILETFSNPHPGSLYVVRLTAPELTTLCPITGQPDFGTLVVDYVPAEKLVESKSFKLFLGSFRNHGTFHEACTVYIHKRLQDALTPHFLRVIGLWNARGGITIDVAIQSGSLPENCELLPTVKTAYRGGRD
jgi:7-cyano-7-deazaguanine reductase